MNNFKDMPVIAELREIFAEQRRTLLSKPLGIQRESLIYVSELIRIPHVVVISGMRRVGKSTLLRQIISEFYSDEDFYYINFEDERLIGFKAEKFNDIYETLVSLFGEKTTFFIDEIQNVPGFEKFVRRFYESGFKFFITGSSANLLSREVGTKLTGRYLDITLQPFSFREYLLYSNFLPQQDETLLTEKRAAIKNHFEEYLQNGGMPEYLAYKNNEILSRTYEDVVIKDVAVRYGLGNILELRELYRYLITNFSNRFSYTKLKKSLGFGSVNTVKNYIDYLCETYFAGVINKFDHSIRKQIANEKKIYVADNGFVSRIAVKLTRDKGRLLENLVYNNLIKQGNVNYFSDAKSECDFILQKPGQVTGAYQVCLDLNEDNYEREIRGLITALLFFDISEGMILTYDQEREFDVRDKKIYIVPVWKWLLENH